MKRDLYLDGKTFRFSGKLIKNSLWSKANWPWGTNKVSEIYETPNGRTVVVVEENKEYKDYNCICSMIREYLVPKTLKVEVV